MIAEFDRRHGWSGAGIKSCAHWLALHCSVAPNTAREHLRVARALGELPKISASFRRGELSYSKVRSLSRVSDRIAEDTLLNLAAAATASHWNARFADSARARANGWLSCNAGRCAGARRTTAPSCSPPSCRPKRVQC
nr:DUF222 domain-containing protein [Nakamurella aerolata]